MEPPYTANIQLKPPVTAEQNSAEAFFINPTGMDSWLLRCRKRKEEEKKAREDDVVLVDNPPGEAKAVQADAPYEQPLLPPAPFPEVHPVPTIEITPPEEVRPIDMEELSSDDEATPIVADDEEPKEHFVLLPAPAPAVVSLAEQRAVDKKAKGGGKDRRPRAGARQKKQLETLLADAQHFKETFAFRNRNCYKPRKWWEAQ